MGEWQFEATEIRSAKCLQLSSSQSSYNHRQNNFMAGTVMKSVIAKLLSVVACMSLVLTHTGNKAREWFISPTSSVTKFRLCCIKHSINIDWASFSVLTKFWKQAENRIDPSGRRKRTLISVLSHTSNSNKLLFQNSIQMSTFYIFLVRSAPWPRKIKVIFCFCCTLGRK